ncbi:WD40 repeat-like protein [Sistotremastrum suecicum HHB10207 ss-3]|uniref:WD40 repeat-like protein n=1 Tax=Sistotremastrum suecicum HHB10207 ss-3 TaxID=1314776 RepID=A0A166DDQ9_9AGAM|nr:WD40 repeat-like protein [Sistotremastrum suecicum HHB10207 ss-3]
MESKTFGGESRDRPPKLGGLHSNIGHIGRMFKIWDVKGQGMPKSNILARSQRFYVIFSRNDQLKQTDISKKGVNPSWSGNISLLPGPGPLIVAVYARHSVGKDELVAIAEETIESLCSRRDEHGTVIISLSRPDSTSNGPNHPTVSFRLTFDDHIADLDETQKSAEQSVTRLIPSRHTSAAEDALAQGSTMASNVKPMADVITPLLSKVDNFVKMVDSIAELHPYAKVAWGVVSSVYKIFQAQKQRDANIALLFESMDDTYNFILESREVFQVKSHIAIAARLVQQTSECGYFIMHYAKDEKFWHRTANNLFGGVDDQITAFQSSFFSLRAALQERATINTEVLIIQTVTLLQDFGDDVNLNDMNYAGDAGFLPEKGCLPGTRTAVIDRISEWVTSPNPSGGASLLWLKGFAGSGKSAIAHTSAHLFSPSRRLGSSFIFDASRASERRAEIVFRTISRDLAGVNRQWKTCLTKIIRENPDLRHTSSVRRQFEHLLLAPALQLEFIGPILIVIDALDECGGALEAKRELLAILATRISELPSNFRILLTSRPERDIEEALSGKDHIAVVDMQELDETAADNDLTTYYKTRLGHLTDMENVWPNQSWIPILVRRSERLFQWAFTACEFVLYAPGREASESLEMLVSSSRLDGIDNLYSGILHNIFGFTEEDQRLSRFRSVLGRVLTVREPLTVSALSKLHGEHEGAGAVKSIVRFMGSLLSGVSDEESPVQTLHTSFRDYLKDSRRSKLYHISESSSEVELAHSALRIMNAELVFNICDFPSSQLANVDVQNLDDRVRRRISLALLYSIRFWSGHLSASTFSDTLAELLHTFIHGRFLFWLEALSLIKQIDTASAAVRIMAKWASDRDAKIRLFGQDAAKFIAVFGGAIAHSAPHVYISALPFSPRKSLVAKYYSEQYPRTLVVETGRQPAWTSLEKSISSGTEKIRGVAVSRNGKKIASGTWGGTIQIWNSETTEAIGPPWSVYEDDADPDGRALIDRLAFSPDDKRIAFTYCHGDTAICLKDVQTGRTVWGPSGLHTHQVWNVGFAIGGSHVLSVTANEVGCWDGETGKERYPIKQLTERHGHGSEISPDGRYIVSLLQDGVILLWEDVEDQWQLKCEFQGHTEWVLSAAFSPDCSRLVTAGGDHTIRIWDIATGQGLGTPLETTDDSIYSLSFSPNMTRVVSGGGDGIIRIWDVDAGEELGALKGGHTSLVDHVWFSHDHHHIISMNHVDGVICIWDASFDNQLESLPLEQRDRYAPVMALSADGELIYSTTHRKETDLQIWEVSTGDLSSRSIENLPIAPSFISVSNNSKLLISGGYFHSEGIYIVDADTGASSKPLTSADEIVFFSVLSDDGQFFASASVERTICLWNVQPDGVTNSVFRSGSDESQSSIISIAIAPDNTSVAVGYGSGNVRFWVVESQDPDNGSVLENCHSSSVSDVKFIKQGDRLAVSGYRTVRFWDAKTRLSIGEPWSVDDQDSIRVGFSSDSKLMVTAAQKTIRVWDVDSRQLLYEPFEGHSDWIRSVHFAHKDTRIVSSCSDGTIRIWVLDLDESDVPETKAKNAELRRRHLLNIDAWVSSGNGCGLLFWVPPFNRDRLLWGRCHTIIGDEPTTLNLDYFEHGESWTRCRLPR